MEPYIEESTSNEGGDPTPPADPSIPIFLEMILLFGIMGISFQILIIYKKKKFR